MLNKPDVFRKNKKIVNIFIFFVIFIIFSVSIIHFTFAHNSCNNTALLLIVFTAIVASLTAGYFLLKTINPLMVKIEALYEYNDELYSLFNNSQDSIAICNKNADILIFNNKLVKDSNFLKKDLFSMSLYDLVMPQEQPVLKKALEKVYEKKELENLIFKLRTKDESFKYMDVSFSFLDDKKRILVSFRNIDSLIKQHQKMFAVQTKLSTIGEMVGSVGHQWKQPLSVISAILINIRIDNSLGNLKDEDLEEYLSQVDDQITYMSSTLDDFKCFIDSKEEIKNFKIKNVIDKVLKISQKSFEDNNIKLISNIDTQAQIVNSQKALMQIMMNILSNAKDQLKEKNDVDNRLVFIELVQNNNEWVLSIYDNGFGVDEAIIDKIFLMDISTKKDKDGSGFGLYMTKKLVEENMNSKIEVFNKKYKYNDIEQKGACFVIKFKINK